MKKLNIFRIISLIIVVIILLLFTIFIIEYFNAKREQLEIINKSIKLELSRQNISQSIYRIDTNIFNEKYSKKIDLTDSIGKIQNNKYTVSRLMYEVYRDHKIKNDKLFKIFNQYDWYFNDTISKNYYYGNENKFIIWNVNENIVGMRKYEGNIVTTKTWKKKASNKPLS